MVLVMLVEIRIVSFIIVGVWLVQKKGISSVEMMLFISVLQNSVIIGLFVWLVLWLRMDRKVWVKVEIRFSVMFIGGMLLLGWIMISMFVKLISIVIQCDRQLCLFSSQGEIVSMIMGVQKFMVVFLVSGMIFNIEKKISVEVSSSVLCFNCSFSWFDFRMLCL